MPSDLSYKLLKIQQNLSFSQEELAEKLNVSFATVNRWKTVIPVSVQSFADRIIFESSHKYDFKKRFRKVLIYRLIKLCLQKKII